MKHNGKVTAEMLSVGAPVDTCTGGTLTHTGKIPRSTHRDLYRDVGFP